MTTTNNPATTQTAADSDVATVTTTTTAFVDDDGSIAEDIATEGDDREHRNPKFGVPFCLPLFGWRGGFCNPNQADDDEKL